MVSYNIIYNSNSILAMRFFFCHDIDVIAVSIYNLGVWCQVEKKKKNPLIIFSQVITDCVHYI